MPLFEVDASRPLLVQPGGAARAVEPGLGTTAHRVVDSHIDGLLGEQIFPVAQGVGQDEPHLLALDATGSPVVVELVKELDKAALTRALDHAGWAGRLTRGELASRYQGGAAAFHRDVASFYDAVPITRSQPGRSSARLIIICQDAGQEILNAVDFLRQPTMPVEVLRMGVVNSEDGRRFVDVSPLVIHPASASAEPRLSVGSAPGRPAEAHPGDDGFAEGVKVGIALTGKMPAVSSPPDAPEQTTPEPQPTRPSARRTPDRTQRPEPTRRRRPRPEPESLSLPSVAPTRRSVAAADALASVQSAASADTPLRQDAPVRRRSRTDRFTGSATEPALSAGRPAVDPEPSAPEPPTQDSWRSRTPRLPTGDELGLPELARRTTSPSSADSPGIADDFARAAAPALDLPLPPVSHSPIPAPPDPYSGYGQPTQDPHRPWAPSTPADFTAASEDLPRLKVPPLEAPSYTPPPERSLYDDPQPAYGGPQEEEVDGDLIALASTFSQPVLLVWSRPRRRQHFEAALYPEGYIELVDGRRFQHPDRAASAASGTPTDDGWNVWHLGDDGPSLLDAYRQRFA